MVDSETDPKPALANNKSQAIVDKLVFAALKEQTRARRWRIFYMLFFIGYLSVVTIVILRGPDSVAGSGPVADGDKHTAVIKMSGVIASGEAAGSENIIAGLKSAFKHDDTAGIVLEINSPGGSPVQSAYIFDEILRLRQEYEAVPIFAVVSDIAASGGYFVAAATDKIYVNKSSLVGSIGVRMDSFGVVDLMKKLGIERRLLIAGENKGLADPFLPENSGQKAHLQTMLGEVHEHFIGAVKQGRGERLSESPGIFSGLIWSGERALTLGLVDAYGSTASVARELEAEEIVDFTPKVDLLERFTKSIGSSIGRGIQQNLLGEIVLR